MAEELVEAVGFLVAPPTTTGALVKRRRRLLVDPSPADVGRYIPQEIWERVLVHLPLRSSIRFAAVCKAWHTFLRSSEFVPKSLQSPVNEGHVPEGWLVSLQSKAIQPWLVAFDPARNARYKIQVPRDFCNKEVEGVAGSFLFFVSLGKLHAWNPITGQSRELFKHETSSITLVVATSSAHKVMNLAAESSSSLKTQLDLEGGNRWRTVSFLGFETLYSGGFTYDVWDEGGGGKNSYVRVAKILGTSPASKISIPSCLEQFSWRKAVECNGDFLMVFGSRRYSLFQIWKLDGHKSSWVHISSMPTKYTLLFRDQVSNNNVKCVATRHLVFLITLHDTNKENIVAFDYETLRWSHVENLYHTRRSCMWFNELHPFYPSRAPLELHGRSRPRARKRKRMML